MTNHIDVTSPLVQRFEEFIRDSDQELAKLNAERSALIAEREEEVKKVRADYAARISQAEEIIRKVEKMRNAMDSTPRAVPKPQRPTKEWRPSDKLQLDVLRALEDGLQTTKGIAEVIAVHSTTVSSTLSYLRRVELARMKGTVPSPSGGRSSKAFAITPAGRDFLTAASQEPALAVLDTDRELAHA